MNSAVIGIVMQKPKRIKLDHVSCNYKIAHKGNLVTFASTVNLLVIGLIAYYSEKQNYDKDTTLWWNFLLKRKSLPCWNAN